LDASALAAKTASILQCDLDEAWLKINQEALERLQSLDLVRAL
jgi:hypothetical protein